MGFQIQVLMVIKIENQDITEWQTLFSKNQKYVYIQGGPF